jgi:hypothetical protein
MVALLAAILVTIVVLLLRGGSGNLGSPYNGQTSAQQAQPPEFPRMQMQGQFAGPLQGTVIQRWRDPIDGTICYLYMPMVVQHSPAPSGYVQYGSNSIGSISCMPKGAAAAN